MSAIVANDALEHVHTHVGPFDFVSAFSKTVLDVLPLVSLMVSQTSDEIIK